MGKKQGDESDLMADFFGEDDLDWLDDAEAATQSKTGQAVEKPEQIPVAEPVVVESPAPESPAPEPPAPEPPAPQAEMLPVAPPPPPAFKPESAIAQPEPVKLSPVGAPKRVTMVDQPLPEMDVAVASEPAEPSVNTWEDPSADQPAEELANGETLTPPTVDMPEVVSVEVEVEDTQSVDRPTPVDVEIYEEEEEAVVDMPPVPQVDEDEFEDDDEDAEALVTGDQLEASGQTPAPMVRTHELPEPRQTVAVDIQAEAYTGPDTADGPTVGWEASRNRLVWESASNIDGSAEDLFHAARIAFRRLGAPGAALLLLESARQAGFNDVQLHRERAAAATELGQWDVAEKAYAAVGELETPVPSSEAWQEAAGAAAQLDNGESVVRYLRYAVQACPTDVIALSLLRDQLPDSAVEERRTVTESLVELCPGAAAAELWWQSAQEARSSDGDARGALEKVLEHEPDHTAAVIRLRNLLIANADHANYALLLAQRAERTTGADAAWWQVRSAAASLIAGDLSGARTIAEAAVDGWAQVEPRWLAALRDGQHAALIGDTLAGTAVDDSAASAVRHMRAAASAERSGDTATALERVTALLAVHPSNPVAQANQARWSEFLTETDPIDAARAAFESEQDPQSKAVRAFILGVALERSGDSDGAIAAFAQASDVPGAGIAKFRLADSEGRKKLIAETITWATDKASWLLLQAVGAPDLEDDALVALNAALEARPADVALLFLRSVAVSRIANDDERLSALAAAATSATDPSDKDAANIAWLAELAALGRTDAGAVETLQHLGARAVFAEATTVDEDPATLLRTEAIARRDAAGTDAERMWWGVAAADAAMPTAFADAFFEWMALSEHEELRAVARASALEAALANADVAARLDGLSQLLESSASDDERGPLLVHLIEELSSLGNRDAFSQRVSELLAIEDAVAPWRALALSAESLGEWRSAVDLLEHAGGERARLDWARLVSGALADPASGLRLFRALDEEAVREAATVRALNVSRVLDDLDAMAAAHGVLADGDDFESFRAAHAGWAADAYEELGNGAMALKYHARALSLRDTSQTAFHGARRLTIHAQDGFGLNALYSDHSGDRLLLAEDLEAIGDKAEALSVWTDLAAKSERPLFALVAIEALQRTAEDWPAVLATLQAQRALVTTTQAQGAVDAAIVELLGTHLPDSDEAYVEYGRLAEANPQDRSIAAKYARMAGVRGETATAVEALTRLGETAESPEESAEFKALLGDMLRNTGDADGARQSYLDALDHAPGHSESLSGLRALAEDAGDSGALLAVLNRELGAAQDDNARVAKLVEIAEVTATQEDADPTIVMDAWRAVVDQAPDNRRAAQELTDLAGAFDDGATFDFAGSLLVNHLSGDARTDLLRKLGQTALQGGSRDAAVSWFEQAVNTEPPDALAARELEPLYEASNNWDGLQSVLALRVAAGDEAPQALAKAAEVALRKQANPEAADALYVQLLELEPANAAALKYRADRAFADKDFTTAAELFTRLGDDLIGDRDLDDFDDRLEASLLYYRYGVSLVQSGSTVEAVAAFEQGLQLDGTHLPSLEQVAPLYRSSGDYDRASDAYRRILQLARSVGDKPGMAAMYVELGLVDHAKKDDERAAKRFGKALELDPNHAPALLGMALIYEEQGEFDNCWKSYNAVIHNASNRDGVILAYLRKGRVLDERKERLDKAAEHYERCLEVEPSQTVALVRLAEILTRLDRSDDAVSVATRALHVEGIDMALQADLHAVVAYVQARKDNTDAATQSLEAAIAADNSIADALGEAPLDDLDAMSLAIRRRLPVT